MLKNYINIVKKNNNNKLIMIKQKKNKTKNAIERKIKKKLN